MNITSDGIDFAEYVGTIMGSLMTITMIDKSLLVPLADKMETIREATPTKIQRSVPIQQIDKVRSDLDRLSETISEMGHSLLMNAVTSDWKRKTYIRLWSRAFEDVVGADSDSIRRFRDGIRGIRERSVSPEECFRNIDEYFDVSIQDRVLSQIVAGGKQDDQRQMLHDRLRNAVMIVEVGQGLSGDAHGELLVQLKNLRQRCADLLLEDLNGADGAVTRIVLACLDITRSFDLILERIVESGS